MKKLIVAGLAAVASAVLSDALGGGGISNPAWIYRPSEGIIVNNNDVGVSKDYELNVQVVDKNKRTLAIGDSTWNGGAAYRTNDNGSIKGGSVLDLSESIADTDGNAWTIVKFNGQCFRLANTPVRKFVAPKELVTIAGKVFDYDIPSGETIDATFDCPNLTALPNGTCGKNWVTLHIKAPSCTYIDQYAMTQFAKIDIGEWDLTGVESVGYRAMVWPTYPTGTLKWPNLKTIGGQALGQANYTRVEWGNRYNTLTSVDVQAINCSVEELVLGCAKGCTFASNAINAGNLKRVWMTGAVPVFTTSDVTFGTSQAEKTMVFYVPDTEEWADIRANATKLTDDEIAAFKTAHPDREVPFGVVGASVFQTQNAQYLGTANLEELGVMSKVEIASRSQAQYGDTWTITVNGETLTDGGVPCGADVTVTAKPVKNETIVSWEGKLPDGTIPTGVSFTYKATASVSLTACFAQPWEYDAEAQTISDGYWTLPVTVGDNRELTTAQVSDDTMKAKSGELNLSGPIYTKGAVGDENARWTIVALPWQGFQTMSATSFYAPTTLKKVAGQLFNGSYGLVNVVYNCPELTGNYGDYGFMVGRSPVSHFVLNAPKLTSVGQAADTRSFNSMTFVETDLAEWDLTSVKEVRVGGFGTATTRGGPKGDLVLPNVETIGASAFDGWTRITSASFGINGTLKSIGGTIFWNPTAKNGPAAGPTKLDFGSSWDFTVDSQAFYAELPGKVDSYPNGQALPLKEVWFSSKAPSVEALDNILALQDVAEDGSKPVKIFAPMMEKTWKAVSQTFTADEQKQALAMKAEGLRVVGVYKTAAGKRVAWLVQNPNFEYYTGLCIRIR